MTMHLSDLYGPDDNPDLTRMLNGVRQGLLPSAPIDVGFRRKDGASVPTSAVLALVELSDQTLITMLSLL